MKGAFSRVMLLILLSLPLELRASGREADFKYELSMSRGIIALDAGRVSEARKEFSRALKLRPGDAHARFDLALCDAREGKTGEAIARLRELLEDAPDYREARGLLGDLERREIASRVNVRASARYEYDDNVTLLPDDTDLVGESGEDDFRFATTFEIDLVPVASKYAQVKTGYALYQSVHNRLGDFNLQAHEVNSVLTFAAGALKPYVGYIYRYYFLDDNKRSFIRDNELTAGVGFPMGRHNVTMLDYGYTAETNFLEYADPEDDRTSRNNVFGLDHYLFFGRNARFVRFGIHYDRNDARGDNYTYNGYRFEWELFLPIAWGWYFNGEIDYYIRDFPKSVNNRQDQRQEYYAKISRNLNEHVALGIEFYRIVNSSRVDLFEFDRNVYSVLADFMF